GVSPKLRKLREGLDQQKFPTDALLQHGLARIVYGVPRARNLRENLLGMVEALDYIFERCDPSSATEANATGWMERWLSRRIESDDVLDEVSRHTAVRDGRYLLHGACVRPLGDDEVQPTLFDDLAY